MPLTKGARRRRNNPYGTDVNGSLVAYLKREVGADCYLYCIRDHGCSAVKVGFSRNPIPRFRQIQTGNPNELELLGIVRGDVIQEQAFHRVWADRRLSGEWFDDADYAVSDAFLRAARRALK